MLGRYELAFELFRNDVGALWAGRVGSGEGAGSIVAVRRVVTKAPVTPENADAIAEAAFAALGLRNDYVVPIVDVVVADTEIGIVSEHVEGEPLRSLVQLAGMRRAPMADGAAVQIALALLEGVAFVHRSAHLAEVTGCRVAGLSPDGILVGADGRTRLMEVGVSGVVSTVHAWSRAPGRVAYEAPEKLDHVPSADGRADVFTVGVLLWEMLVNRRLFPGADYDTVSQRVRAGDAARADSVERKGRPAMAAGLADVVERALHADPARRFQTAGEMAEALRACGEAAASSDEVAAFVGGLMRDTFATRRRRLERTLTTSAAAPAEGPIVAPAVDGGDAPPTPLPAKEAASDAAKDDAAEDEAPEVAVDVGDDSGAADSSAEEAEADEAAGEEVASAPEPPAARAHGFPRRGLLWAAGVGACVGVVVLLARGVGHDEPGAPPSPASGAVEPGPAPPPPIVEVPPMPEPVPPEPPTEVASAAPPSPASVASPQRAPRPAKAPAPPSKAPPARASKKFTPKGI